MMKKKMNSTTTDLPKTDLLKLDKEAAEWSEIINKMVKGPLLRFLK